MQTAKQKEWYLKNKKKVINRVRIWKKNNPKKVRKYRKKYYLKNKKRIFLYSKIYKKNHYIKKPRKFRNLIGKRFGRLKVLSLSHITKKHDRIWNCTCSCGKNKKVSGNSMFHGRTKSCGCLHKTIIKKMCKQRVGSKNPGWKADSAKYRTIHSWLQNNFKFKKEKCIHCKKINKRLDFSLIKGEKHSHNIKNYITLCRKCHVKYDNIYERRKKNVT